MGLEKNRSGDSDYPPASSQKSKKKELNLQISNTPIHIKETVGILEMIYLLEKFSAVMTDSGGLQKEAFFFKKHIGDMIAAGDM